MVESLTAKLVHDFAKPLDDDVVVEPEVHCQIDLKNGKKKKLKIRQVIVESLKMLLLQKMETCFGLVFSNLLSLNHKKLKTINWD